MSKKNAKVVMNHVFSNIITTTPNVEVDYVAEVHCMGLIMLV